VTIAFNTTIASPEAQVTTARPPRATTAVPSSTVQRGNADSDGDGSSSGVVGDSVAAALSLVNRYRTVLSAADHQRADDTTATKSNLAANAADKTSHIASEQVSLQPRAALLAQANLSPRVALALLNG